MKFTKKDIKNYILSEGKDFTIFSKKNLILKEDETKSAFVEPTNASSASSDLTKAKTTNPTANEIVANGDAFDNETSNNNTQVEITGSTSQQQVNNAKTYLNSPSGKKLGSDNITFHFRENAVRYTKKELNEMLKSL